MKNKETIEELLQKEYDARDGTMPMSETDWANNQGWIEALEWVLGYADIEKEKARVKDKLKAILPSPEELNIIIKNAINRIKEPKE